MPWLPGFGVCSVSWCTSFIALLPLWGHCSFAHSALHLDRLGTVRSPSACCLCSPPCPWNLRCLLCCCFKCFWSTLACLGGGFHWFFFVVAACPADVSLWRRPWYARSNERLSAYARCAASVFLQHLAILLSWSVPSTQGLVTVAVIHPSRPHGLGTPWPSCLSACWVDSSSSTGRSFANCAAASSISSQSCGLQRLWKPVSLRSQALCLSQINAVSVQCSALCSSWLLGCLLVVQLSSELKSLICVQGQTQAVNLCIIFTFQNPSLLLLLVHFYENKRSSLP